MVDSGDVTFHTLVLSSNTNGTGVLMTASEGKPDLRLSVVLLHIPYRRVNINRLQGSLESDL